MLDIMEEVTKSHMTYTRNLERKDCWTHQSVVSISHKFSDRDSF